MATNNLIKVSSGSVPPGTVNGASAKGTEDQGNPSGSLAKAPPGESSTLGGGKITGFGSGKPDASTVNGSSAAGSDQGSVSGKLAAQPASTSGSGVKGFQSGIKAGKI